MNPFDQYDVNDDGFVVPGDVLYIINELNHPTVHDESGELPLTRPDDEMFYDANGDGYCSPRDVLLVINLLNSPVDPGEGEASVAIGAQSAGMICIPGGTDQRAINSWLEDHSRPAVDSRRQNSSIDELASAGNCGISVLIPAPSASVGTGDTDHSLAQDCRLDSVDLESLESLLAADR
jgi:hypothetical protein